MEETKAEAARILEVIKAGDADKAAGNLSFLVKTGLIASADRVRSIQTFIANRHAGEGPALPAANSPVDAESMQMMLLVMQGAMQGAATKTEAPKLQDAK
jgi:hypothetical protein